MAEKREVPMFCRCGLNLIETDLTETEEFNPFTGKKYGHLERKCAKYRKSFFFNNGTEHDFWNISSRNRLGWSLMSSDDGGW